MKTINGVEFLTPQEAAEMLGVSYKTLQRWTDAGERWARILIKTNGNSPPRYQLVKERRTVRVEFRFTRAGHRMYRRDSIDSLANQLLKEEKQRQLPKLKQAA